MSCCESIPKEIRHRNFGLRALWHLKGKTGFRLFSFRQYYQKKGDFFRRFFFVYLKGNKGRNKYRNGYAYPPGHFSEPFAFRYSCSGELNYPGKYPSWIIVGSEQTWMAPRCDFSDFPDFSLPKKILSEWKICQVDKNDFYCNKQI